MVLEIDRIKIVLKPHQTAWHVAAFKIGSDLIELGN